jgi:hypothetical protein
MYGFEIGKVTVFINEMVWIVKSKQGAGTAGTWL